MTDEKPETNEFFKQPDFQKTMIYLLNIHRFRWYVHICTCLKREKSMLRYKVWCS